MDGLKEYFLPEAFQARAKRRSVEKVRRILHEDREQLLHMLRTRTKTSSALTDS
jgi:hypothetical protein